MSIRGVWAAPLLLLVARAGAAEPARGFQEEKRVRQATRLDWDFAAGRPAKLPQGYDPRKVRYQLYAPPAYKATKDWPLIVFVSPGDAPLGWGAFKGLCEKGEVLFCAAHGAGNDCDPAQRFRTLCDVLDDVRREYRVDPDRTYLAGQGGAAPVAMRLAAALPELFGGVMLINGDAPLPRLDHLRFRLGERLSVALVCGEKETVRARVEQFRSPLLTGLGVRAKFWKAAAEEGELPAGETLAEAFRWLDSDLKRRRADTKEHGGDDPAESALKRAERDLRVPERVFRAAAELEWLAERFGQSEAGRTARERLREVRDDPRRNRALVAQREAESRRVLLARARALTQAGRAAEARRAWKSLAASAPDAEQRGQAEAEAKKLADVLARTPYLGLTCEGETATVRSVAAGGPADRAGLRAGDRIEKRDGAEVGDLRAALSAGKPGDVWALEVRRGGEVVKVTLTLGAVPES